MYAQRYALSHGPRPVPVAASLLIGSAMLAALVFVSPTIKLVEHADGPGVWVRPVDEPPPVPPEQPTETPQVARETVIYTPPVPTPPVSENPVTSTYVEPAGPPPVDPGRPEGTGTVTTPEPPLPPPPPLIGAKADPRFARDFQPVYPPSEIRLGREGRVSVRVRIGTDGRVKAVEEISATSAAFFEATRRHAMNKWRFQPATRGGVAQESWKVMSVNFVLEDR